MTRIAPGEAAPDFRLETPEGDPFHLYDLVAKQPVLLVLNRGFLCPFCKRHMIRLRRDYPEFHRRGAEIVAVGPERPEDFKRHWVHLKLPFVGLPDPGRIALDRYCQRSGLLSLGRLPALFVLARGGEVLFAHYSKTMADIPPNRNLLAVLDGSTG